MSTGSQTAKVQVEVEARTDAAVTNFERLQSSTKKSREEVEKIEKATTRAASALRPLTAATEKQAAASSKASTAALAFGKAVDTAKGGAVSIGKAALAATSAFGPWGIAIGAVGTALWGLVDAETEATKRSKELREELAKQQRSLDLQRMDEKDAERGALAKRRREMEAEEDEAGRAATRRSIRFAIEDLEKKEARGGRGAEAARREMAELRALHAESLKDYDTARQIRHEEELRLLSMKGQVKTKKELIALDVDADPKFTRSMMGPNIGRRSLAGQMEDDVFSREAQLSEQRRIAAQFKHDIDDKAANDEEYRERARQERFEREIQRIRDEKEERELAAEASMRAGAMIADSAAGIAEAYLTSGDLSARGFRKAVGQFASAEAIRLTIVAIREFILGSVAASNPFTAALAPGHFAAAGQATAGAATLGALALTLGAAGGGGGMAKNVAGLSGSAFGPGSTVAANDRPSVSNSQKDTTPVSSNEDSMRRSNSAAAGGSSTGGGIVVYTGPINVTGAIDNDTSRKIAKGLKDVLGRDGRITG